MPTTNRIRTQVNSCCREQDVEENGAPATNMMGT
jgi:hypothetical protein